MEFYKMQALKNDFIVINDNFRKKVDFKSLAVKLCDRKTGIGGDGLIVLSKSKTANCKMTVYNKDGSKAETCGNGLRCVALLNFYNSGKDNFKIQTANRISTASVKNEQEITVKIGKINTNPSKVGLVENKPFFAEKVNVNGKNATAFFVSVGNPHAVFLGGKDFIKELENIVKFVKDNNYFLNGTNIEVCETVDKNTVKLRIYERGVGETNACGTGASATVGALVKLGVLNEYQNIKVNMKGGSVTVRVEKGNIYLTGSAGLVYKGEIDV